MSISCHQIGYVVGQGSYQVEEVSNGSFENRCTYNCNTLRLPN